MMPLIDNEGVVQARHLDFVGPQQDTDAWRDRYRGWMRVLITDASVCTAIALVITCAYYLLGASILNKLNVSPEGFKVVEQVSLIFTESIGGWAEGVFLFPSANTSAGPSTNKSPAIPARPIALLLTTLPP